MGTLVGARAYNPSLKERIRRSVSRLRDRMGLTPDGNLVAFARSELARRRSGEPDEMQDAIETGHHYGYEPDYAELGRIASGHFSNPHMDFNFPVEALHVRKIVSDDPHETWTVFRSAPVWYEAQP